MSGLCLAVSQMSSRVGGIEYNTQKMLHIIHQLNAQSNPKIDCLIFPELVITGYPPEDLLFHADFHLRVENALMSLCAQVGSYCVVVGYPQYIDGDCYNVAAVIQNKKIIHHYAKRILPNDAVFDEQRYFCSGKKALVFSIRNTQVAVLICEDIWHAEPVQSCVHLGAELLICINASPFSLKKTAVRQKILRQHSQKHAVSIVYVNSVGGQDELIFDGHSMWWDQTGNMLWEGPHCAETLEILHWNTNGPMTPRTQTIDTEALLYEALILGVRDYVNQHGFSGVILGLSGGVDSALTAAIACDALGPDRVRTVMMPSTYTSAMSLLDAEATAQALHCAYQVLSIDPLIQAFSAILSEENCSGTTEENIQARCRGHLLMTLSNAWQWLVLTTSNKSELAMGYSTLYGDMAGGFCVLKDVYKTMVYRLARYRNTLGSVIPERTIRRPPSAELTHDQCDQHSLPLYPVLDAILDRFLEHKHGMSALISGGFEKHVVQFVLNRVQRSEYKRRQAPIGPRLSDSAFGKDWRYPITHSVDPNLTSFKK